jgi:hypothetical protein
MPSLILSHLPEAPRASALVLAYYNDGRLTYAGRVGTGFTTETARALFKQLLPLRTAASPCAARLPSLARKGVVWVEPKLAPTLITEAGPQTSNCGTPHSRAFGRTRTTPRSVVRESSA